ncbi:hypothetical protein COV56_00395 [Candidatus Kuenenbacteria bacterium CG11_big_fil_rev_8_21_14_0_20_37_9]|uniref:Membrane insertase YidC/Oxa/ALB C-terminal domain-containing protein n=1 Tax=Candidatus Kuenenbacteria bacterium CG08_land_8_20_14_0_20_37_23 TaxID=1974617 RepID=A0A2M6XTL6_9BACT|nr:MAG: hypothetical protein COV56_00395 [Candidatus Kuenenbacteria bacterium CG11_big_fil_rev_8_21_14_0_20_37_9]PIU10970.1 MAG: hypothetical protein COT27_00300 [Candidatus Kuenenbacteria bacterium CG08_land_8_20_14_0_20_37_23]
MIEIYNIILYRPLFNLLIFFYNTISFQDVGIAIILVTVVIKLILYPLSVKSIKAQKALQDLQPKMDSIKQKYKNNKEQLGKAMMELYKTEKISPVSSCLPLLIQFPFLIAVYNVFRVGFKPESLDMLYGFIHNPNTLNPVAFGFLNLAEKNIVLAVLAGAAQFWSSKMLISKKQPKVSSAKDEGMTTIMNKQMLYFMPAITIFFGISLPGGLTFYWFLTTVLTALQQLRLSKKHDKDVKIEIPKDVKSANTEEIKGIEK